MKRRLQLTHSFPLLSFFILNFLPSFILLSFHSLFLHSYHISLCLCHHSPIHSFSSLFPSSPLVIKCIPPSPSSLPSSFIFPSHPPSSLLFPVLNYIPMTSPPLCMIWGLGRGREMIERGKRNRELEGNRKEGRRIDDEEMRLWKEGRGEWRENKRGRKGGKKGRGGIGGEGRWCDLKTVWV